jgi:hypothetical protein
MNDKETVPKRTHIVQQAYLKNFSRKTKKGFFLYRFDKQTEKVQYLNVKRVAVEKHFYPPEVETWLANEIEAKGISILNNVIENKSIDNLPVSEKEYLIRWILVQDTRTREMRNEIRQVFEDGTLLISKTYDSDFIEKYENLKVKFNEDFLQAIQLEFMVEFLRIIPRLMNYKFSLLINKSKIQYFTADHPIFRYNTYHQCFQDKNRYENIFRNYGEGDGYLSPGVEIRLPLNPSLCLIITEMTPAKYHHIDKQIYSRMDATYYNVVFVNERLSAKANRFIYSKNKDFSIAKRIIRDNPDLRFEDKKRIEIV